MSTITIATTTTIFPILSLVLVVNRSVLRPDENVVSIRDTWSDEDKSLVFELSNFFSSVIVLKKDYT